MSAADPDQTEQWHPDDAWNDAGELLLRSDLTTDEARAVVGRTLAMIETDCAGSWPTCPRVNQLICDCRLRAVRACNAMRMSVAKVPK